ncbi:hypothetical protein [Heyndrickxia oleronia]|uniref:hypothetical protein n=1 Tax=Heyndrickxia oleronia TaxID=38875 RepID=UPI003F82B361
MKLLEQILDSNLVGSLIGTTIAGLIAVYVMKNQLNYDKKIRRKKELELILKMTKNFSFCSSLLLKELKQMMEVLRSPKLSENQIKKEFQLIEIAVNQYINSYNFSASSVPYEVFHILTKNEYISKCIPTLVTDIILTENFNDEQDMFIKEINDLIDLYTENIMKIKEITKDLENEFNSIKVK